MKKSPTGEVFSMIGRKLQDFDGPTAQALLNLAIVDTFESEQSHSVPALGIEVSVNRSGQVTSAHLHGEGHEGFRAFPFKYRNISINSSRQIVQTALGKPLQSGCGRNGPWDVYELVGLRIHFLYSSDATSLALVTVCLANQRGQSGGPPQEQGGQVLNLESITSQCVK